MELKEIDFTDIEERLQGKNVIYGAGHNGKFVYELLDSAGVQTEFFYDDDVTRWGENYCGKRILSKKKFELLDKNETNIIISSIYTEKIAEKLIAYGFKKIYTVLDELLGATSGHLRFSECHGDQTYLDQIGRLIALSEDTKTRQYFEVIRESVLEGKPKKEIIGLYDSEDQYFLNFFREKLEGINFIDGGAYTGDTVREILENNIHPAAIYCFEADRDNYSRLENYVRKNSELKGCICENYALWDCCTQVGMHRSGYNACIDLNSESETVQTITIDDYFKNIKVGFVKMDIEGAEKRALTGGMGVLKRDRPLLAIAIYHSLEDIVEIPQLLMQQLTDYHFIVRSHSNTYSEAVLYGVPVESGIRFG